MDNLKENQLIFMDENNKEVVCDILFTYYSENFNKNYVFFIPIKQDNEDGRNDVACASYIEKDNVISKLNAVETNEEWEELEEVFTSFLEEAEENEEE